MLENPQATGYGFEHVVIGSSFPEKKKAEAEKTFIRETKFRGIRLHFTPPGLSLGNRIFIYVSLQLKLLWIGFQLDIFKILHMNVDQSVGILGLEAI